MQCPHHPMCKTVTGLGPRLGWRGNKRQWGGDFPVIRSSRSTGPHIFNFGMCREVQGSGEKGEQNSSRAEKLPVGSRCLHCIPNCILYPIPYCIPRHIPCHIPLSTPLSTLLCIPSPPCAAPARATRPCPPGSGAHGAAEAFGPTALFFLEATIFINGW